MPTPSSSSTLDLKILAWLGAVFFVLALCAPILLGYVFLVKTMRQQIPLSQTPLNEPLGELGSHCGGQARLPCRPGLECSAEGLCVAGTSTQLGMRVAQLGEQCSGSGLPCAPGLFCASTQATTGGSTCRAIDAAAPTIQSLSLEGAQPTDGGYVVSAGATIKARVQTVNVQSLEMWRIPASEGLNMDLATRIDGVKNASGGVFEASFSIASKATWNIGVKAIAKDGGVAWLFVPVASIE